MRFTFDAELYRWAARKELWTFVDLPEDAADMIREVVGDQTGGWGSVRVDARIGGSAFRTSIFPGGESGTYLLPVKRAVREAEGLELGELVTDVEIDLVDF